MTSGSFEATCLFMAVDSTDGAELLFRLYLFILCEYTFIPNFDTIRLKSKGW